MCKCEAANLVLNVTSKETKIKKKNIVKYIHEQFLIITNYVYIIMIHKCIYILYIQVKLQEEYKLNTRIEMHILFVRL